MMQFLLPIAKNDEQIHTAKWDQCEACPLCETRHRVVLWRGHLPCDVLFIGEAPGPFEDTEGLPFIGPSGVLLNDILADVALEYQIELDVPPSAIYCYTNLVACFPKDNGKPRSPTAGEIQACSARLREFIEIAKPKKIIAVGKIAKSSGLEFDAAILHPSTILQADKTEFAPLVRKQVTTLVDLLKELRQ